jgi:hypothetical protein
MVKQMARRQSGILTKPMLRPRSARAGLLVPFVLALSVALTSAQTPKSASKDKAAPPSTSPQTYEESTRFLKTLPPKPATQLPYPSIATPPIEDQAPIPLMTESQLKKAEEDLTKLNERHQKGMPKETAKQGKPKGQAAGKTERKPRRQTKAQDPAKPLQITN